MLAPKWMRNNERGIFWAVMIALVFLLGAGTAVVVNDGITELDVIFIFGVALALALFAILRLRPAATPATAVEPVQSVVEDGPTGFIPSPRQRPWHLVRPATVYRGTATPVPTQPRRHLASVQEPAPPRRRRGDDGVPSADETVAYFRGLHAGLEENTNDKGLPPFPTWGPGGEAT